VEALESESESLETALAAAQQQSTRDSLTGTLNRRGFEALMEAELARCARQSQTMVVIMIDADHFKKINDAHGHQVGDQTLKSLATLVQRSLRRNDHLARIGGEEFVAVLPGTGLEEATSAAEKIRERVANAKFHVNGSPVPVSVSCGISEYADGDTVNTLVARADDALYQAKSSGRNRCCVV
jgi:diguanylate cyclase